MNLTDRALDAAHTILADKLEGVVSWACTPLTYNQAHRFIVTACVEYGTMGDDPDEATDHVTVHTVLVTIDLLGVAPAAVLSSTTVDL